MTVIAFFAILFTGRYPRAIFDFNVGVLRWTWRVAFYAYGALGTDRYPPFSLAADVDYPATLDVDYPERLSRGSSSSSGGCSRSRTTSSSAVLLGGGSWFAWQRGAWGGPGLILIAVLIAGFGLLFTGRYPSGLFDLALGLDRRVLRVAAYAGLMTDEYPPFRLDQGGSEPGSAVEPAAAEPEEVADRKWSGGRIAVVVIGSILALASLGVLAGGAVAVVADQTQRDSDGFLVTPSEQFDTGTYALVSETIAVTADIPQWVIDQLIGTVRIKSKSEKRIFIGIAPEAAADSYLSGVRRAVVKDISPDPHYSTRPGGPPATPPGEQSFWVATKAGAGEQVLDWNVEDGDWVVVVMNADASSGVTADLRIGAEIDSLIWIGVGLLGAGLLLGLVAAGLIYVGIPKRLAPSA